MICQNCGQREATICVVKIANNKMEKKYICPVCASKIDNFSEGIEEVINPLFNNENRFNDINDEICPTCGQSRRHLKETGEFNCKDCYNFLEVDKKHIGKVPSRNKEELYVINIIEEKEKELKKLVVEERYEEAAVLRDEIKGLKKESESDDK